METKLARFAEMLHEAKRIVVITGAGISADSGLPTYRGIGGLYDDGDTEDGMPIEKALSGPVFQRQPEITWKYLAEIERGARGATFNRGHEVLAEMEAHFDELWILTQNVDGFHGAAGSTNVIEIHGNLHRMKCTVCKYRKFYENYDGFELPPTCPDCQSLVRPDVVLFEEQLPEKEIQKLYACHEIPFDLVISIGTSSYFPYIIEPVLMANRQGVPTVEINPGTTSLSDLVELRVPLGAAEALDRVWPLVST
ncbi:MAG: NAD-dependent protein deacylase [Planctomycetota bacterium]